MHRAGPGVTWPCLLCWGWLIDLDGFWETSPAHLENTNTHWPHVEVTFTTPDNGVEAATAARFFIHSFIQDTVT